MNWVDLFLIAVILLSLWNGWQKGFIMGIANLITWAGSLACGFLLYPYPAYLIENSGLSGAWTKPVAFILTVILARILLSLLLNRLLRLVPEEWHTTMVNRVGGLIPGLANGLINAMVFAALFFAIPLFKRLTVESHESKLAQRLVVPAFWLEGKLAAIFSDVVHRPLQNSVSGTDVFLKAAGSFRQCYTIKYRKETSLASYVKSGWNLFTLLHQQCGSHLF